MKRRLAPTVQSRRESGIAALLVACGVLTACGDVASQEPAPMSAPVTEAATQTPTPVPVVPEPVAEPSPTQAIPVVPEPPASDLPAPPGPAVAVIGVIDGDTIDTVVGRVRVIGIDTPERGECNFGPATSMLKRLIADSGNQVVLTAVPGKDDTDRYGRLLRYIDSPSGLDLGRELIAAGLAIARYDSRDGYGSHPREADYVSLDSAVAQVPCPGASG